MAEFRKTNTLNLDPRCRKSGINTTGWASCMVIIKTKVPARSLPD